MRIETRNVTAAFVLVLSLPASIDAQSVPDGFRLKGGTFASDEDGLVLAVHRDKTASVVTRLRGSRGAEHWLIDDLAANSIVGLPPGVGGGPRFVVGGRTVGGRATRIYTVSTADELELTWSSTEIVPLLQRHFVPALAHDLDLSIVCGGDAWLARVATDTSFQAVWGTVGARGIEGRLRLDRAPETPGRPGREPAELSGAAPLTCAGGLSEVAVLWRGSILLADRTGIRGQIVSPPGMSIGSIQFDSATATLWASADDGRLVAFPRADWKLRAPEAVAARVARNDPDEVGFYVLDPERVGGGLSDWSIAGDGRLLVHAIGADRDIVASVELGPTGLQVSEAISLTKGGLLAGRVALEPTRFDRARLTSTYRTRAPSPARTKP